MKIQEIEFMKKITAIVVAMLLIVISLCTTLTGCKGETTDMKTLMYRLGLTEYESLEKYEADAERLITREEVFDYAVRISGLVMETAGLSEKELKYDLVYYADSDEISEKYKRNVSIAAKKRLTDDGNADNLFPTASASGKDVKFTFAAALGFKPEENGENSFFKGVKLPSSLKSALKKETVSAADFLEICGYVLNGKFQSGEAVADKLVYQKVITEKAAYGNGLAGNLFAKRLSVKIEKLTATKVDGINNCLTAISICEDANEYISYAASYIGKAAKSAISKANKQIKRLESECETFFGKALPETPTVKQTAVTVGDKVAVASKITSSEFTAVKTDTEITLKNGFYTIVFGIENGITLKSFYNAETASEMLTEDSAGSLVKVEIGNQTFTEKEMKLIEASAAENGMKATLSIEEFNLLVKISVTGDSSEKLVFSLEIENGGSGDVELIPTFPNFKALKVAPTASESYYLYPKNGGVISNKNIKFSAHNDALYGAGVTFPVMSFYSENGGGIYMIPLYQFTTAKFLYFQKTGDTADMSISYYERKIKQGESFKAADVEVGIHAGDWYNALTAYKNYLSTWYEPIVIDTLDGTVTLETAYSTMPSVPLRILSGAQPSKKVLSLFKEADALYGGYEIFHWFDWWNNLGDYNFSTTYGGVSEVRNIANIAHDNGKLMSLYTESVLANDTSEIVIATNKDVYRRDKNGNLHCNLYYDVTCIDYMLWQDHYVDRLTNIAKQVPVDMIYMDQFGNHNDLCCYVEGHNHSDAYSGLEGQTELAIRLRKEYDKIREGIAYGGEYPVTDYISQYVNYVFTYNCCKWYINTTGKRITPGIDLYTFLFPNVMLYSLNLYPGGEAVLESNADLICSFFNGAGRNNLVNESENYALIRKCSEILLANDDCFRSNNKTPLLNTDKEGFMVNKFVNEEDTKTVYTFLNRSGEKVEGIVLPKAEGDCLYYDLWNNRPLNPVETENGVYLDVTVLNNDTGAVAVIVK